LVFVIFVILAIRFMSITATVGLVDAAAVLFGLVLVLPPLSTLLPLPITVIVVLGAFS
jgi:hypothetical protein